MTKSLFVLVLLELLFLISASFPQAYAQSCNCDYTITTSGTYDNATLGWAPGSVICIDAAYNQNFDATTRHTLYFKNFISESASQRFIFKNCGGQVVIKNSQITENETTLKWEPTGSGITFDNCKNFRLTGSGTTGVDQGILIQGQLLVDGLNGPKWGVRAFGKSTDFEIDHVKVADVLFAGFDLKTDPSCNDPSAWRGAFTMQNVSVHDNAVERTQRGEGFYIGYSFYNRPKECPDGTSGYGHEIENIEVFNNTTDWTASEGIQVGSAPVNCRIYNNVITNYGHAPLQGAISAHGNGLQLGEGTGGLCYNNFIKAPVGYETASSLKVFGINNVVFNNILLNANYHAVYATGEPDGPGSVYKIYNNVIVHAPKDASYWPVKLANANVESYLVKNNIIINPHGNYVTSASNVTASHNFQNTSVQSAGFTNPANDDYTLTSSSPCIDNGVNLYSDHVTIDFDGDPRPASGPFEQGAYEYGDPTGELVWHSYNIRTQDGAPQGFAYSESDSVQATFEFYQSANDDGVDRVSLFSTFNAGTHTDPNAKAEDYWANGTGEVYPFAGKSTVGRGSETGEGNVPAPLGVFDLNLHPPQDDKLTVAAFVAPVAGVYTVSGLAVRRVMTYGVNVEFKVFDSNKALVAQLIATNDQDWQQNPNSFSLGTLAAGDRIYFATDRSDTWAYDFTEVAFTITSSPTVESQSWNSYDIAIGPNQAEQGAIIGDQGTKAVVEFYESTDLFGVTKGSLFSYHTAGNHPHSESHATNWWKISETSSNSPFAGLSTVGRGSDVGETNAPAPLDVIDLQLHPPNSDRLTVAAFIVPAAGTYEVSNLAARRVSAEPSTGGTIRFQVFDQAKVKKAELVASNNQLWVTSSSTILLEGLAANDRIYFATARDGSYAYDFTEVSWTVKHVSSKTNSSARTSSTEESDLVTPVVEEESVGVYPNPVESVLFVKGLPGKETSVRIYDSHGIELVQENVFSENGRIAIEVGQYRPGIYFMVLQNGRRMQRYKFLKK